MERTTSVIRPGTPPGSGQPSSASFSTSITGSARKLPFERWKRKMLLERVAPTKPLSASGSCSQRTSSGTSPCSPRSIVCCSRRSARSQKWSLLAVASGPDVLDVESLLVRVGLSELRRDQHVLARLVPEVVVHRRPLAAVLPAALHLEGPRVEDREPACAAAVPVAQHADHDVVARHAVDGVGPGVARAFGELLRLDDLLDARPPRVVGDVERRGSATSGIPARSGASDPARGTPSCSGSSRNDGARRRRSASASRERSGPPRHRRRRGSRARPPPCPCAGRPGTSNSSGGAFSASSGEA